MNRIDVRIALLGLVFLLSTSIAHAQVVDANFNDVLIGDLASQSGGSGWAGGSSYTSTGGTINVVAGDLLAPASTNYALSQTGTAQHVAGSGGSVAYYRDLANPYGSSDSVWFSFIAQITDADASLVSGGRTGLTIDTTANNVGRLLMRGISGTGAGDPGIADMEIFRAGGGGSNDYDLDLDPFLVVGRLDLNPTGNDELSWWYNPDVTTLDPNVPDESFFGRNWDSDNGISTFGVQVYGNGTDEGRIDALRFSNNGATGYFDVTGVLEPSSSVDVWASPVGGSANTGSNWTAGVPATGANVKFGNVITEDQTVTIDAPLDFSRVAFVTSGNAYDISGPSTLTLSGGAEVNVSNGSHSISADLAGSSGLVKTGGGTLFLSGNNSYTGTTDIQGGLLRVTNTNSLPGGVNVASGGHLVLQGTLDEDGNPTGMGFSGTFNEDITGDGLLSISDTLSTEVVVFNGPKSFGGVINVNGGTLEISDPGALGTGGSVPETRTQVNSSNAGNGTLRITGNINISDELIRLDGRQEEVTKAHIESSGTNTISSPLEIRAASDDVYTIESTAGTLAVTGDVFSNSDTVQQTLRVGGAGDGTIAQITDVDPAAVDPLINANINLEKFGTGTWTITTASTTEELYHRGTTTVSGGTLAVAASGNDGELQSSFIRVQSAGTLDTTAFGVYNLQAGQGLGGGGQIDTNVLGLFSDNVVEPGDSVGTLQVNGDMTYGQFAPPMGIDPGNMTFELGSTTAVGGGANDLIDVSGNVAFSGTDTSASVNIVPVEGQLVGGGSYTVIRGSSVTGTLLQTPQITDANGNPLTTRQSVSLSQTFTEVNVNVSGSAANLTWNGNVDGNWDVSSTQNWTNGGGNDVFVDLDQVTFDNTSTQRSVAVAQEVKPGNVALNHTTGNYTFTGSNSISVLGAINANSGTTVLANDSNSGKLNVNSGAVVQGAGSGVTTGTFVGNVSVASGGTLRVGDDGISGAPPVINSEDFEGFGTGVVFTANATTGTPAMPGWTFVDARSTTSTQTGSDDVEFELIGGSPTGSIALTQTNTNTDFPNSGAAHNGSQAISPFDTSGSLDTITAQLGQNDPSGGFADATIIFGWVDQDNYFYAQVSQGEGIAIRHVSGDVRQSSPADSGNGIGSFQNNVPWDVTLVHNSATGSVSFTVSDGVNTQSISANDSVLMQEGLIGFGSHNDSFFVDNLTVRTEDPSAASYTIDGDLDMVAGATLQLDVAGVGNSDQLIVSGNLAAAGTLEIVPSASFDGSAGDLFQFLDFDTSSGAFDAFDLPTLNGGLTWDTSNILVNGTLSIVAPEIGCDLDGNSVCDINDLDRLYDAIADGMNDMAFDVNGDGFVDNADIDEWLVAAGTENGKVYLDGDTNLDGSVGGADFTALASNFGNSGADPASAEAYWGNGNFDGISASDLFEVGGPDFTRLATNFGHVSVASVPEPQALVSLLVGLMMAMGALRRR